MSEFFIATKERILKDHFLRSSAIVFAGSFLVNILNYLFNIVTARLVNIEVYGEYTALASLLILFSVPATALTMFVSREVAGHANSENEKSFLDKTFNEVFSIALFVWILFLILVPFLSEFLNISWSILLIFSLLFPVSFFSSMQNGYLQGRHNFRQLSIISILSTFSKFIIAVGFLYLGLSIYGIITALILASLVGILYDGRVFQNRFNFNNLNLELNSFSAHFISITFFTTLALAILQNIDVVLAKHYLSSTEAGIYGALSTIGKIIIFAVGSFTTVMMPFVSKAHSGESGKVYKIFQNAFLSVVGLGSCITFFFFLFPEFSVHILFGSKYAGVSSYLGIFSLGMLFMAASISLVNFFIATRNKSFIYLFFIGLLVEVFLLWYTEKSVGEYVWNVTISALIIFVLLSLNYLFIKKKV